MTSLEWGRELVNLEWEIQQKILVLDGFDGPSKHVQEMNKEIRSELEDLHVKIRNIQATIEIQKDDEKAASITALERHQKEETVLYAQLRKANINAAKNAQNRFQKEKAALLEGGENAIKQRQLRNREAMMQTSSGVTDSLRMLNARMAAESQRSTDVLKQLVQDSVTLNATLGEHQAIAGGLSQGKWVLSNYRRRETTDKILIGLGFLFFICVVVYIVLHRLRVDSIMSFIYGTIF
eukprot:TRINITY_DN17517_c0_g1_i1.p1 TRINITY_DN17517_c0_g1~~TRINITY_DN17517_c0_g1_i1.p1  ORF type:complete len:237 (+),score=61.52 TRINITY_DN17517_c0_g1_i1:48-758(+)